MDVSRSTMDDRRAEGDSRRCVHLRGVYEAAAVVAAVCAVDRFVSAAAGVVRLRTCAHAAVIRAGAGRTADCRRRLALSVNCGCGNPWAVLFRDGSVVFPRRRHRLRMFRRWRAAQRKNIGPRRRAARRRDHAGRSLLAWPDRGSAAKTRDTTVRTTPCS